MSGKNWTMGLLVGALGGALITLGATGAFAGAASDRQAADSVSDQEERRVLEALQGDLARGLDRWYSGDPFGYAALYADDISYFDPGTDVSLESAAALRAYYEPLVGRFDIERYETVNFRLQLHGDLAILTFNLNEYDEGESPTAEWKVTQVYRKLADGWKVIHGHFSSVGAE